MDCLRLRLRRNLKQSISFLRATACNESPRRRTTLAGNESTTAPTRSDNDRDSTNLERRKLAVK
ncbi:MAG: hypothetical protein ACOCVR_01380, partial [Myxococcota bacterium]